jgi:hypothetical protein
MVAPTLVAAASRHGALVAASLTDSQLVRAFPSLARNFGTAKITQLSPAFPNADVSCRFHLAESKEGV